MEGTDYLVDYLGTCKLVVQDMLVVDFVDLILVVLLMLRDLMSRVAILVGQVMLVDFEVDSMLVGG